MEASSVVALLDRQHFLKSVFFTRMIHATCMNVICNEIKVGLSPPRRQFVAVTLVENELIKTELE